MTPSNSGDDAKREFLGGSSNPKGPDAVAEVPEDPSAPLGASRSFSGRVRQVWPISLILGTFVFFLLTYIHDRQCSSSYAPALLAAKALATELGSEAGNVVPDGSGPEGSWTVSRPEAVPHAYELLDKSCLITILDRDDFAHLQAAFPESGSASNSVEEVAKILNSKPESEEAANEALGQAVDVLQRVHSELQKTNRQPFLFGSEPPFLAELRVAAHEELGLFKAHVDELRKEAGYQPLGEPIVWVSDNHLDQLDKLIPLTEHACRHSRISFLLIYTISGGSTRDKDLQEEFLELQEVAWQITSKLAEDDSLKGTHNGQARVALTKYAGSMDRRIRWLGGAGGRK